MCLSCIFGFQLPWGFDIAFYIYEQDCCKLFIFEFQMCLCSPPLTIVSFSIVYLGVVCVWWAEEVTVADEGP